MKSNETFGRTRKKKKTYGDFTKFYNLRKTIGTLDFKTINRGEGQPLNL